ncbi:hypothetical protein NMG60_11019282 [Bertholletia excelsa]
MAHAQMPPTMTAPGLLANETVCYPSNMVTTHGIWLQENPLHYSLPLFLVQTIMITVATRILMLLHKPLNMPRIFNELTAGILLGPSGLGKIPGIDFLIFNRTSLILLETIANFGIIYYVFIIGLEMDISLITQHGKKAMAFAFPGMLLPALIGCGFSFSLYKITSIPQPIFLLVFCTSVSITALPVLTRILAELRLLDREMGKLAKTAAVINEMVCFLLLVFAVSIAESPDNAIMISGWIILSATIFISVSIFAVRPAMSRLIMAIPDVHNLGALTTSFILAGVTFYGFIADAIGVHPALGAFLFGLILPSGPLATSVADKLEDFVMGFMLPIFYATVGLKSNLFKIMVSPSTMAVLLLSILLSTVGKVVGTLFLAFFTETPFREAAALGLLMNAKGGVELMALNLGKDQKVMDGTTYAMIGLLTMIMNSLINPLVMKIYKPARKFVPYKRRTIQKVKADEELRILACIHTSRNVPTIVNLIEATHPTKRSPISVFSLHLVELTGHGSSRIIVHGPQNSEGASINKMKAQSDHIVNAFDTMEQHNNCVSVQSFTAISPYAEMDVDICNLAEEKRVSFIVLPFHKQQTVDGGMEVANPKFRTVNDKVLRNAPCSVGILVDRGLNGSNHPSAPHVSHNIAVLFFGGADDREALCYGMRMSEHQGNTLNVIRFITGPEAVEPQLTYEEEEQGILMLQIDKEKEKQIDDELIKEVRMIKANDESFSFIEKVVNNGEETVAAIRSVESMHDLFIVGRGGDGGTVSALTAGLTEWSECPELGLIGDFLASADFAPTVSVLVVQQFGGGGSSYYEQKVGGIGTVMGTGAGAGAMNMGIATPTASQVEEQWILDSNSSTRRSTS